MSAESQILRFFQLFVNNYSLIKHRYVPLYSVDCMYVSKFNPELQFFTILIFNIISDPFITYCKFHFILLLS